MGEGKFMDLSLAYGLLTIILAGCVFCYKIKNRLLLQKNRIYIKMLFFLLVATTSELAWRNILPVL